jgi:hypothetical protein
MRQLFSLWMVICCCGFAAAQTDQALRSTYAEPFAPRLATPSAPPEALSTPSLTLDPPNLTVGASTGTPSPTGSPVYVNQPLRYEPGVRFDAAATSLSAAPTSSSYGIELGAAMFQSSYGVAQLASTISRGKAKRVYTNQDVASVNDTNGLIKFRGKLEHAN